MEVSLSHGDSSRALVVTLSGILMLVVANQGEVKNKNFIAYRFISQGILFYWSCILR